MSGDQFGDFSDDDKFRLDSNDHNNDYEDYNSKTENILQQLAFYMRLKFSTLIIKYLRAVDSIKPIRYRPQT